MGRFSNLILNFYQIQNKFGYLQSISLFCYIDGVVEHVKKLKKMNIMLQKKFT